MENLLFVGVALCIGGVVGRLYTLKEMYKLFGVRSRDELRKLAKKGD